MYISKFLEEIFYNIRKTVIDTTKAILIWL